MRAKLVVSLGVSLVLLVQVGARTRNRQLQAGRACEKRCSAPWSQVLRHIQDRT